MLPRRLLMVPLLGVAAVAAAPVIKPVFGPLALHSWEEKWRDGVCLQSTGSTCGPASVATILRYLGREASEAELAREAHSYAGGTEAWYLARAARARGCETRFDLGQGFDPDGGLPAMAGVRLGGLGHFIAILSRNGGHFVVADPMRGREEISADSLTRSYEFTGFHLRFEIRE